ncbi:hypothetical protein [Cetobacterium sp.]|uniref:hypothetical protein n=1 Tax=Cetobacterium sp. TaxID=2071632 RepID=UPI003F2F9FE4
MKAVKLNICIESSYKKDKIRYKKKLLDRKLEFFIGKDEFSKELFVGEILSTMIKEEDKKYNLIATVELWHLISNTLIDKHGDILTRECLIYLEECFKVNYFPIYKEHDFTNPPIGKWIDAKVIDHEEESYLFAKLEFFKDEKFNNVKKDKIMKIVTLDNNEILFDRNFRTNSLLNKLIEDEFKKNEKTLNIKVQDNIKKSYEFNSEIIIKFALQAIAVGFFSALGGDLYNKLKNIIKKSFIEMEGSSKELHTIFINNFTLPNNEIIEIKTIFILNKNFQEIDVFSTQPFLEKQLQEIIEKQLPIRTIVNIVEKNKKIEFGYSLTKYGDLYEVKKDDIFRKMLEKNKL